MRNNLNLFDAAWLAKARAVTHKLSWVTNVLDSLGAEGTMYLNSIREWFNKFPLTSIKDKRALKSRLESSSDSEHLGGVNELSWWEFMLRTQVKAVPVATSTAPRPDFQIPAPNKFFLEVSTLNPSAAERRKFESEAGIVLNHSHTMRRILRKAADEKRRQIAFAARQKLPCALVLFDYTPWSSFETQFFRFLANGLLGSPLDFSRLPVALSALVYVERKVIDGQIAISRDRSAVYYNPKASYPLPAGTFSAIRQFWGQMMESQPQWQDHWVRL